MALIDRAAGIVEQGGVEAWSALTVGDVLGAEGEHAAAHYTKSNDILDVWFDSGSSFFHVLNEKVGSHPGTTGGTADTPADGRSGPEADLYVEGHDQHRGWFHSSLLICCAMEGHAPYRGLLTHGFTVDGRGRKMSKSLGNFISLQDSTAKLGAEIVRLWAAATDYSGDLGIDEKILARVVDSYRRIRNTLRFLLANTSDFDAAVDAVPLDQMLEIDRWALARTAQFQAEVLAHYEVFEFHPVVAKLQVFCSEDLGAFYLDVLKDRLYTTAPKSLVRRSAQTALHHITHAMLRWMAPFLSFTAEEAWKVFAPGKGSSIFVETYSDVAGWCDESLLAKWKRVSNVRHDVNKAIEVLRAAGELGSSLQAKVTVRAGEAMCNDLLHFGTDLKFVLITSQADVLLAPAMDPYEYGVDRPQVSSSVKCERCWHYRVDVGHDRQHPTLCNRCTSNLYGSGEHRTVA